MKNEMEYSLTKFKEAVQTLSNGIELAKDELGEDGVIQRFEFTFELLWKALKIFLEDKGIICRSPKDCLKNAFKYGLFSDEELFLKMLEDRNTTTHIYNREDSREIFNRIKSEYLHVLISIYEELEKLIGEN
ncbi:MAG: HI0074 family nucleotidyltransferase substrate-binding subunit [Bacteroidota bacterium]